MLLQELPRVLLALSPPLIQPKRENAALLTTACMKVENSSQAVIVGRHQTKGRLVQAVLEDHQLGDAVLVIDTISSFFVFHENISEQDLMENLQQDRQCLSSNVKKLNLKLFFCSDSRVLKKEVVVNRYQELQ